MKNGPPPRRSPSMLEATAYHEAGHAAAAFLLRRRIRSVTILPDNEIGSNGTCKQGRFPSWFKPDARVDDRHRLLIEQEVIILYAGGVAKSHFQGHRRGLGDAMDHDAIATLVHYCRFADDEHYAFLKWLLIRTRNLITDTHNWQGVKAIAEALLAKMELKGKEAREVFYAGVEASFGDALPPLPAGVKNCR